MRPPRLHRFVRDGKRYAVDTETGFCFECDAISWDVLDHYPDTNVNRIYALLEGKHARRELEEVIGELEWLRATKAILPAPKATEIEKQFALERGLTQISLCWPLERGDRAHAALYLLLGRSGGQQRLRFTVVLDATQPLDGAIETLHRNAVLAARLAGKTMDFELLFENAGEGHKTFAPHRIHALIPLPAEADVESAWAELRRMNMRRLDRVFSSFDHAACAIIEPAGGDWAGCVGALRRLGARHIQIDANASIARHLHGRFAECYPDLEKVTEMYAQDLLNGDLYRLEPLASLFNRIHRGEAQPRGDAAGVRELAVDEHGGVFASRLWLGHAAHRVGNLTADGLDQKHLARYEDIGATTTPACMSCWARNICGGGPAAVHETLSGSFREPAAAWCEAQRRWIECAIAAFSQISARGVDFSHLYSGMGRVPKPSFLQLARAAWRTRIGLRPLAEADAPMLQRWENWNGAAYFTTTEQGLLLATQYDREMDALHPRPNEQEFLLLRRNGTPLGLLRLRPDILPATARAWLYFRKPQDYADSGLQRAFRELLREAAKQQALRTLIVPAGPFDPGLGNFLRAAGFKPCGCLREGLYLHAAYHDVTLYATTLES